MVYSNEVSVSDPVENRTVREVLERQLRERPDQLAIRDLNEALTYRELFERSCQASGGFTALGVQRGDGVLLMLDNHVDYILSWFGLSLMGAVEVPVNTAYRGSLLSHVINDSGAAVLVVEDSYLPLIADVRDQLTGLNTILVRGGEGDFPHIEGVAISAFDGVLAGEPVEPVEVNSWDLLGILYTSGTTGNSKGVLAPQGLAYSYSSPKWIEPGEVVMCNLPLFHIGGQWAGVYSALIAGGSSVILPRFSATTFWEDVRRFGCTQALILGAMASFLAAQPEQENDNDHTLRHINMVPLVADHEAFAERFGVSIGAAYGLTEFSAPVLTLYGDAEPGLAGRLRSDFEARIVDEHDIDVPVGKTGELVLRAKVPWAMMAGYHGLPDKTSEAWRNLWFHTGDAMRQDEQGRYFFVDRNNDAMRVRGENISSVEVEKEIDSHPEVVASVAVAVPSQHTEDEIKVAVVRKKGSTLTPEDLLRYLVPRTPYFMVPRYFDFVSELPMTPTQKFKKAEVRAAGITATTWDRSAAGFSVTRKGLEEPNGATAVSA